ncbi:hypothetical protein JTB14_027972 [Gonioctena quinquepunctata]|nr:hypothetical protein JTB14_027972 [Gonioctena quinquepunctata]
MFQNVRKKQILCLRQNQDRCLRKLVCHRARALSYPRKILHFLLGSGYTSKTGDSTRVHDFLGRIFCFYSTCCCNDLARIRTLLKCSNQ